MSNKSNAVKNEAVQEQDIQAEIAEKSQEIIQAAATAEVNMPTQGLDYYNPTPEEKAVQKARRHEYLAEGFVRAALQNPSIQMLLNGSPFNTSRDVEDRLKPGEYLAERAYELAEQFQSQMEKIVKKKTAKYLAEATQE